jgi:hypothetical protein
VSLSDFDAIVFHIRNMDGRKRALPNPKERKSNQRYVMFLMESPLNDQFPYEKFKGFFNWTMTYRKDSDIQRPYGWAAPKSWPWHYAPALGTPINWNYPKHSGQLAYEYTYNICIYIF